MKTQNKMEEKPKVHLGYNVQNWTKTTEERLEKIFNKLRKKFYPVVETESHMKWKSKTLLWLPVYNNSLMSVSVWPPWASDTSLPRLSSWLSELSRTYNLCQFNQKSSLGERDSVSSQSQAVKTSIDWPRQGYDLPCRGSPSAVRKKWSQH